ncbi:MAG: hypothetical protein AAB327_04380, partial [Actinomycetota bacterium]
MIGILVFVLGATAIGALRLQANEIDRLTRTIAPAIDANSEVLRAMTDADSGLLGYQVAHDLTKLALYRDAHERAVAALATLQIKIDSNLGDQQRLAVEQWWTYALSAEQVVARGG